MTPVDLLNPNISGLDSDLTENFKLWQLIKISASLLDLNESFALKSDLWEDSSQQKDVLTDTNEPNQAPTQLEDGINYPC